MDTRQKSSAPNRTSHPGIASVASGPPSTHSVGQHGVSTTFSLPGDDVDPPRFVHRPHLVIGQRQSTACTSGSLLPGPSTATPAAFPPPRIIPAHLPPLSDDSDEDQIASTPAVLPPAPTAALTAPLPAPSTAPRRWDAAYESDSSRLHQQLLASDPTLGTLSGLFGVPAAMVESVVSVRGLEDDQASELHHLSVVSFRPLCFLMTILADFILCGIVSQWTPP